MTSHFKSFMPVTLLAALWICDGCSKRERLVINTESMAPTIRSGEVVHMDPKAYGDKTPSRWDLVVCVSPEDSKTLQVRRGIGLPDESVSFSNNTLLIDGLPITQPAWLAHVSYTPVPSSPTLETDKTVRHSFQTPASCYYVLGDNPDRARDSRFHGAIHRSAIIGRVIDKR